MKFVDLSDTDIDMYVIAYKYVGLVIALGDELVGLIFTDLERDLRGCLPAVVTDKDSALAADVVACGEKWDIQAPFELLPYPTTKMIEFWYDASRWGYLRWP